MKKVFIYLIIFILFFNLNVKADTHRVCVKAHMDSTYTISISKETKDELFLSVKGDISGDERLKVKVDNTDIDTYIYWNEFPKTIKGKKTKDSVLNYHITLEKYF